MSQFLEAESNENQDRSRFESNSDHLSQEIYSLPSTSNENVSILASAQRAEASTGLTVAYHNFNPYMPPMAMPSHYSNYFQINPFQRVPNYQEWRGQPAFRHHNDQGSYWQEQFRGPGLPQDNRNFQYPYQEEYNFPPDEDGEDPEEYLDDGEEDNLESPPEQRSENEKVKRTVPKPGDTYHIQYMGALDVNNSAKVFDVDLFDTSKETVGNLRQKGKYMIAYINAGAYQPGPHGQDMPQSVRGATMKGWEAERWLDIRQLDQLMPIMEKRMLLAKEKGFHAVHVDNIDGYLSKTGFPLTPEDQMRFNSALAKLAHKHGLAIAMKNNFGQMAANVKEFDFAITESMYQYQHLPQVMAYVKAGKAVFNIEYGGRSALHESSREHRIYSIQKQRQLSSWTGFK